MRRNSGGYVQALLHVQRNTFELIVLAIVLALGINLASSGLPALLSWSAATTTATGAVLSLISLLYLVFRLSPALKRSVELKGILPMGKGNSVEEVPRYEFSEEMRSYVTGLTVENKAIAAIWQKASISYCDEDEADQQKRASVFANQLIREAIEYFLLTKLSLHLSQYFESEGRIRGDNVVRVQRRDIPQLLLDNRFLELFSKPMNEREAFAHHGDGEENLNVVFATGEDGQLFDQFELILPKGSTLARSEDGSLQIKTSRFRLRVSTVFGGYRTNFPTDFEKLYLGRCFDDIQPLVAELLIDIKFAWWSLLSGKGWNEYEWLDSFVESLESSFSFDSFIQSMGWESAHTAAIATTRAHRLSSLN